MSERVDLLLINGEVITGTDNAILVDCIAVKNGAISAIGSMDDVGQLPANRKINLHGMTLIPGFVDAHSHLSHYALLLQHVDCRMKTGEPIDIVLERIHAATTNIPLEKWIYGWGFADYRTLEQRFPTLTELDRVAPNHPLAILHVSGHIVAVNSLALQELRFETDTPDPPDGKIERDPVSGKPNGILHGTAMQDFSIEAIVANFFALEQSKQYAILEQGSREYTQHGITMTCDAMCPPEMLDLYQNAAYDGVLKCSVVGMPFYKWCHMAIRTGELTQYSDGNFKSGAVKLLADGSLSGRSAAVSTPLANTDGIGILYYEQEELNQIVQEMDRLGWQIAIHAIGDRAVDQVVKAYRSIIPHGQQNLRRHRIEHAGFVYPEILQAMREIDIVIATQPRMLYEQGDTFYQSCGDNRIHSLYTYRSYIEAGLHVGGSSDCPVVSPSPLLGMRDAILRQTEAGRVLAPEQCLEPEIALQMFTSEAAYTLFEDHKRGTIEIGKAADFVVLSANPLKTPVETWEDQVKVEMTIVGGEIVYEAL